MTWGRFLVLIAAVLALSACTSNGEPASSPTTPAGFGVDGLVAALVAEGADVTVTESEYPGIEGISSDNSVVCINEHEAIVYAFDSEIDRLDQVGEFGPKQSQSDDLLWGMIEWWAHDNVLVWLHVDEGRPAVEIGLLDSVLGPSVAIYGHSLGPAPEEFPTSENCP